MGVLRFLFAICVVTDHIPFNSPYFFDAIIAVKSFFVISGFYMSLILNEKYSSYRSFILNRFLRLYPIYWIVLFITFVFVLFNNNFVYETNWGLLKIPSFIFIILTNLLIIGQDITHFLGNNPIDFPLSHYLLIGPAWTISIELIFYLAAPFLVKRSSWIIILILLSSTLFRVYMGSIGFKHNPWSYRFFPFELTYFCFGIISYKIYTHLKQHHERSSTALTLYFLTIAYALGFQYIPKTFSKEATVLFPLLLTIAIPYIFQRFKSNQWDRYVGDLSYPIYICHTLMISIINIYIYPYLPAWGQKSAWLLIMFAVILFSMGLLKFISDPIDRYRHSKIT